MQLELAGLRTKWQIDFPGTTHTLSTKLEDLVHADWHRLNTRHALEQFQQIQTTTSMPMSLWEIDYLKQLALLQKINTHAQREFNLLLALLESAYAAIQAKPKPVAERPPKASGPIVEEELEENLGELHQTVRVSIVDGKTVSSIDFDAAFYCQHKAWELASVIRRQFEFEDAIVPEEYAYVLAHEGVAYQPSLRFSIAYEQEEFARLSKLELSTGSQHLLDGERAWYSRRPYPEPRGRYDNPPPGVNPVNP